MTPAGEPTEPTEPTWWQANRRWVIPVGCLGFPTAIGCFIFVVLFAVFAGIKAAYDPDKLVGRQVVMVANLAPRKMKYTTTSKRARSKTRDRFKKAMRTYFDNR